MSDIVKASIIIGLAIIISQGIYDIKIPDNTPFAYKVNKITGSTIFCVKGDCDNEIDRVETQQKLLETLRSINGNYIYLNEYEIKQRLKNDYQKTFKDLSDQQVDVVLRILMANNKLDHNTLNKTKSKTEK